MEEGEKGREGAIRKDGTGEEDRGKQSLLHLCSSDDTDATRPWTQHALLYPDYKFQPMKREDKQRLKEEIQEERTRLKQEKATERLGEFFVHY